MRTIEYLYDLDQMVETVLGDTGIITMLGYDEGGNKYYVQAKESGKWLKESQIQPVNK